MFVTSDNKVIKRVSIRSLLVKCMILIAEHVALATDSCIKDGSETLWQVFEESRCQCNIISTVSNPAIQQF